MQDNGTWCLQLLCSKGHKVAASTRVNEQSPTRQVLCIGMSDFDERGGAYYMIIYMLYDGARHR